MQGYIVCEKKGNFPRIHVKICEHRCEDKTLCEAFQDYIKTQVADEFVVSAKVVTKKPGEKALTPSTLHPFSGVTIYGEKAP